MSMEKQPTHTYIVHTFLPTTTVTIATDTLCDFKLKSHWLFQSYKVFATSRQIKTSAEYNPCKKWNFLR